MFKQGEDPNTIFDCILDLNEVPKLLKVQINEVYKVLQTLFVKRLVTQVLQTLFVKQHLNRA